MLCQPHFGYIYRVFDNEAETGVNRSLRIVHFDKYYEKKELLFAWKNFERQTNLKQYNY
jgi:hypothetical protein